MLGRKTLATWSRGLTRFAVRSPQDLVVSPRLVSWSPENIWKWTGNTESSQELRVMPKFWWRSIGSIFLQGGARQFCLLIYMFNPLTRYNVCVYIYIYTYHKSNRSLTRQTWLTLGHHFLFSMEQHMTNICHLWLWLPCPRPGDSDAQSPENPWFVEDSS